MLIYFLIFSLLRWHSRLISDVAAMSLTQICQKAGIGSRTTRRAMTALLVVILVTQFAVYQYDNGNQAVVQQNWRGNRRHYVDKLNVSTTENLYGNPVSRIQCVDIHVQYGVTDFLFTEWTFCVFEIWYYLNNHKIGPSNSHLDNLDSLPEKLYLWYNAGNLFDNPDCYIFSKGYC